MEKITISNSKALKNDRRNNYVCLVTERKKESKQINK